MVKTDTVGSKTLPERLIDANETDHETRLDIHGVVSDLGFTTDSENATRSLTTPEDAAPNFRLGYSKLQNFFRTVYESYLHELGQAMTKEGHSRYGDFMDSKYRAVDGYIVQGANVVIDGLEYEMNAKVDINNTANKSSDDPTIAISCRRKTTNRKDKEAYPRTINFVIQPEEITNCNIRLGQNVKEAVLTNPYYKLSYNLGDFFNARDAGVIRGPYFLFSEIDRSYSRLVTNTGARYTIKKPNQG